ncbi:RNA polymerase sigma factor [Piscinibacter sakaiensis]|uniref:RNA polymerase sigma factor n=1 Tax=Piscinibacter sakaiensis TaxID=1547922 RepID=UPI003AAF9F9E
MHAPAAFRRRLLDAMPRLRRYARSLEHDDDACDDLVQQSLERALLHWQQFDPQRDIVVWLLAIAHNAFMDAMRRESRLRSRPADGVDDDDTGTHREAPDPGLRLDLQSALASLPADMCEPLLLVCMEQLSYAEAAQVLNLPVGTVLSRVHRARVLLRAFLAGEGRRGPATAGTAPALRRVV